MGAVVDGDHATRDRCHTNHADHGLGIELEGLAPVHDAVLDPHGVVLYAEFTPTYPVRKDTDPRPQCGVPQTVHADMDHAHHDHVTRLGSLNLDRTGGWVHKWQCHVVFTQFLVQ